MFASPSPFGSETDPVVPGIPEDADIIFVADLFVEDYVGGAELTSQALIDSAPSPLQVHKLRSESLTLDLLEKGHQKYWVFGNCAQMDMELIPTIVSNLKYSVLEYDFKYCKWRSPQKHKVIDGISCDDEKTMHGKMISTFYYGAQSLWWMSEAQMSHYHDLFPFLAERENVVLSSVFDDKFFLTVKMLNEKHMSSERKGWIVLGSGSWIKGADESTKWCEDNGKEYELVWGLPYGQLLEKLSTAEGFVYLPPGWDTCPRMVIEAKLLGCELMLNENVQHKDEIWFDTDDPFDTEAYLYAARERFWNSIKQSMGWNPTISGYTTTLNCNKHNYPWRQSIKSMLEFCNEVIVVDGGSEDGTWEELENWSENESNLLVYKVERDWDHPRFAVFDGAQKAEARSRCSGQFCWQQDADEIVHENDCHKVIEMARNFPRQVHIVSLPVVEYWGGSEKVRLDVAPWKWRLSRNVPYITHGIPGHLRQIDDDGNVYSKQGSDGCDYVHSETYELIPHANFYVQEAHNARMAGLNGDKEALAVYTDWFTRNVNMLPSVHHFSWYDLERKIGTYRDYWSKHWQSLYNIEQEDTAENNMFFGKPWSEVSDDDITKLATKLAEEMGGWIFHKPVDFNKTVPHLTLESKPPAVINDWIDNR